MPITSRKTFAAMYPLWVLLHGARYADGVSNGYGCLLSKDHAVDGRPVDGLLLFASPLLAEIYCQRLQVTGNRGWRKCCANMPEFRRILGRVEQDALRVWLVVGFSASHTRELLLDDDQSLMTSSIGFEVRVKRHAHNGHATLAIPPELEPALLDLLAVHPDTWPDERGWREHAVAALQEVDFIEYQAYRRLCGQERPGLALALFDTAARAWRFHGECMRGRH